MSLRLRFVALVVGAVGLTLVALGLPGRRIALSEFESSVHAIIREARVEVGPADAESGTPPPSVSSQGLADALRTPDGALAGLWVDPAGVVVAATDSSWEGVEGRLLDDGAVQFERSTPRGLERVRLAGGRPVVAPNGEPAGLLYRLPSGIPLDEFGAAFSAALDRRLLLWAGGILAGGALLAVILVGQALAPLRRLERAAGRIATGDLGARVGPGGPPEMRAVARAFDSMAGHLEASEAARRRMIRDVAHDLRTPLTNLRGQIESLQDGLRAVDAEALGSLHEEAVLLGRLVSDLDDLARADAGDLDLRPEDLALLPLVERVVEGFVGSGRLVRDEVAIDVDSRLEVRADPAALGRALRNVIDNAVVHGGAGRLEVTAGPQDGAVELEVRDHGPGVAPQHLSRLAERLYRADQARSRGTGGSGLGLSIAAELLRACGGELTVRVPEDGGLAVGLQLPQASS